MDNATKAEREDALYRAQDLIYDVWEARTKAERVKLAKQALAISEDCADAYSFLASEVAKNIVEQRKYYEQAVAAGMRAMGKMLLKNMKVIFGDFWKPDLICVRERDLRNVSGVWEKELSPRFIYATCLSSTPMTIKVCAID